MTEAEFLIQEIGQDLQWIKERLNNLRIPGDEKTKNQNYSTRSPFQFLYDLHVLKESMRPQIAEEDEY